MSTSALRVCRGVLLAVLLPAPLVHAEKSFEQKAAVDPEGTVEIADVAGSIDIVGWDQPQVEVSAKTSDNVERIDLHTSGSRTNIHVTSTSWYGHDANETHILVHVPTQSAVFASLVSANVQVAGVKGDVSLRTVSGNISGEVAGNLRVNTVSGHIHMTAREAKSIEAKSIDGEIQLTGGSGEAEVTTVSGNAKIELASLSRGRFKSISGNMNLTLGLSRDAELEGESVSGILHIDFTSTPSAQFDVQSFSGRIDNCFGPKPAETRYGPGTRLEFKNGEGSARVRLETKSGNVELCAALARRASGANGAGARRPTRIPVANCSPGRLPGFWYVI